MPLSKYLKALLSVFVLILASEIPLQAQDTVIAGLKGKIQTVLTEEFTSDDGISREPSGSSEVPIRSTKPGGQLGRLITTRPETWSRNPARSITTIPGQIGSKGNQSNGTQRLNRCSPRA